MPIESAKVSGHITTGLMINCSSQDVINRITNLDKELKKTVSYADAIFELHLDGDAISPEELNAIYTAIFKNKFNCRVIITNDHQYQEYNELFLCLSQYIHRYYKSVDLKERADNLLEEFGQAEKHVKTRQAKIDMVNGKVGKMNVSINRQQQQQQQQQQQSKRKLYSFKKKEDNEDLKVIGNGIHDGQGEFITRENIIAQMKAYTDELFPGEKINLEKLWDDLVGANARYINPIDRPTVAITHVNKPAMELIIKHYKKFKYGVIFDNLPPGFIVQPTNDGQKLILDYNPALIETRVINPFTVLLSDTPSKEIVKDYRQVLLDEMDVTELPDFLTDYGKSKVAENPEAETFNKYLYDLENPELLEMAVKSLVKLTRFFTKNEILKDQVIRHLDEFTQSNLFTISTIKGFASILLKHGPEALLIFLDRINAIQNAGIYDDFSKFLERLDDYTLFTTQEGLANLDAFLQMDQNERRLFLSLSAQHKYETGENNFNDLFAAFSYFLTKVKGATNGDSLPLNCNFMDVRNMKVALDRLYYIITHTMEKSENNSGLQNEQLKSIAGLNLSAEGAYFACRYNNYNIVNSRMYIVPPSPDLYGYQRDVVELCKLIHLDQTSMDETTKNSINSDEPLLQEERYVNSMLAVKPLVANSFGTRTIKAKLLSRSEHHDLYQEILDPHRGFKLLQVARQEEQVEKAEIYKLGIIDASNVFLYQIDENGYEGLLVVEEIKTTNGLELRYQILHKQPDNSYNAETINCFRLENESEQNNVHAFNFAGSLLETQALDLRPKSHVDLFNQLKGFTYAIPPIGEIFDDVVNGRVQNTLAVEYFYRYVAQAPEVQLSMETYLYVELLIRKELQGVNLHVSFLYTALALCGSKRTLASDEDVIDQLKNLLAYLKDNVLTTTYANTEGEEFLEVLLEELFFFLNRVMPDIRPSFNDLKIILEACKNLQNPSQVLSMIQRLFITSRTIPNFYDILAGFNQVSRLKLNTCDLEELLNRFTIMSTETAVVFKQLIDNKMDKYAEYPDLPAVLIPEFAYLLTITSIPVDLLAENISHLCMLLELMELENPKLKVFVTFFKVIRDISLSASVSLLDLKTLVSTLIEMKDSAELVSTMTESELETFMREKIAEKSPEVHFKNFVSPVNNDNFLSIAKKYVKDEGLIDKLSAESLSELYEDIRTQLLPVFKSYTFNSETLAYAAIDKLLEFVQSKIAGVISLTQELLNQSQLEEIDEHLCFDLVSQLEMGINNLLNYQVPLLKIKLFDLSVIRENVYSLIEQMPVEDERNGVKKFLETRKIIDYVIVLIDEAYFLKMEVLIHNSLGITDARSSDLMEIFTEFYGAEKIATEDFEELVKFQEIQFIKCRNLLNSLIILKNTNKLQFQKLIQVICSNKKLINEIPIELLMTIINELNDANNNELASNLADILDGVHSASIERMVYNSQHLMAATKGLIQLEKLRNTLDPKIYEMLKKYSVKFYLSNSNEEFPLQEIIKLQLVLHKASTNENEINNFINKIIDVVKNYFQKNKNEEARFLLSGIIDIIANSNGKNTHVMDYIQFVLSLKREHVKDDNDEIMNFFTSMIKTPNPVMNIMNLARRIHGETELQLDQFLEIYKRLMRFHDAGKGDILISLTELYQQLPYPTLVDETNKEKKLSYVDSLLSITTMDEDVLLKYMTSFAADPFAKRNSQTDIDRQFAVARTGDMIGNITDLLENSNISQANRERLAHQFLFVNNLGKSLVHLSRNQLKVDVKELINKLRVTSDPDEKEKLQLRLLALIREIIFRTTGNIAYPSQMLAVLNSMNNGGNLLMQIDTGEGKSLTTAMLSILQWANGETVDVCTATTDLVVQDFEKYKLAFDFLKIRTSTIVDDAPYGTYQVGGINYSTVGNLSLYYSRAKMDGENLKYRKGRLYRKSLILDESDYTILDERTLFNFSTNTITGSGFNENPFAWVYPVINDFVDLPAFQMIDPKKGIVWSPERDKVELLDKLRQKADTDQKQEDLQMIMTRYSDILDRWINAACTASTYKEGKHFRVEVTKRTVDGKEMDCSIAQPIVMNVPQPGSTFTDGVQQFLHARLQKESQKSRNKRPPFSIDSELVLVASESAKTFLRHYKSDGRIIGITGTAGNELELREQYAKLDATILSLPPREVNKRVTEELVAENNYNQIEEIKQQIKQSADLVDAMQPSLLVCEDPLAAKDMFEKMTGFTPDSWLMHRNLFRQANQLFNVPDYDIESYKEMILKLTETVFKDVPEVKNILNKILHKEQLQENERDLLINIADGKFKHPNYINYQLVVGDETPVERKKRLVEAGFPNTVTITTSLLGRGIDIDPKHKNGLLVIQTYLDTERITAQIKGRAARNGMLGKYVIIFNNEEVQNRYGMSLMNISAEERKSRIKQMQKVKSQENAIERRFIEEYDTIRNIILKQFTRWFELVRHYYGNNLQLINEILSIKENLIIELDKDWKTILNNSNPMHPEQPGKLYANPYIRWEDGKLQDADLLQCVELYKEKACERWATRRRDLIGQLESSAGGFSIDYNQTFIREGGGNLQTTQFAIVASITNSDATKRAIDARHVTLRAQRKIAKRETKEMHYSMASLMDEYAAELRYNDQLESKHKEELTLKSCFYQSSLLFKELGKLQMYNIHSPDGKKILEAIDNLKLLLSKEPNREGLTDIITNIHLIFKLHNSSNEAIPQNLLQLQKILPQFLSIYDTAINKIKIEPPIATNEIELLRIQYSRSAVSQMTNELINSLQWVKKKISLSYLLENREVCRAAEQIYDSAKELNMLNTNSEEYEKQVKKLIKLMEQNKKKIARRWSFNKFNPFGHKDTVTTLQTGLISIEKWQPVISQTNIVAHVKIKNDHKENKMILDKLMVSMDTKYVKKMSQSQKIQWAEIQNMLQGFITESDSIYIFFDGQAFLEYITPQYENDPLLSSMLASLLTATKKITESLGDQYEESEYKAHCEARLKKRFADLGGAHPPFAYMSSLRLRSGHNGIDPEYSLLFEGEGDSQVLQDLGFIRGEKPKDLMENIKQRHMSLDREKNQEIAIINQGRSLIDDVNSGHLAALKTDLFPNITDKVAELIRLQKFTQQMPPLEELSAYFNLSPELLKLIDQITDINRNQSKVKELDMSYLASVESKEMKACLKAMANDEKKLKMERDEMSAVEAIEKKSTLKKIGGAITSLPKKNEKTTLYLSKGERANVKKATTLNVTSLESEISSKKMSIPIIMNSHKQKLCKEFDRLWSAYLGGLYVEQQNALIAEVSQVMSEHNSSLAAISAEQSYLKSRFAKLKKQTSFLTKTFKSLTELVGFELKLLANTRAKVVPGFRSGIFANREGGTKVANDPKLSQRKGSWK